MKKNRPALFLAVLAIIVVSFLFVGCSKTVASVNGVKIKQSEVNTYIEFLKNQNPDTDLSEDSDEFKSAKTIIINSLIDKKLLEEYAKENNIEVDAAEVDGQFEAIASSYPTQSDFEKDLKEKNISTKFLKEELSAQILVGKIFEKVTENIFVSPDQAREYYDENKEVLFKVHESVKISHILAMVSSNEGENEEGREEALEKIKYVETKLDEGEKFEDLAEKYSDDTASSVNGGDLGYISKGQLVEEIDEVAFLMDVGEVSEIIETSYGFHIIKITDKQEEHTEDFEEVEGTIINYLGNVFKEEKWESFTDSLRKSADIKYYVDIESFPTDEGEGTEEK